eukprot:4547511-Amphidinium_carterae.1
MGLCMLVIVAILLHCWQGSCRHAKHSSQLVDRRGQERQSSAAFVAAAALPMLRKREYHHNNACNCRFIPTPTGLGTR